jgi:hypothetical protein
MKEPNEVRDNLDEGDSLTVTYGEEVFAPVQYNNMRLGPFSVTITVRSGETATRAFKRAHDLLETMADRAFEAKIQGFRDKMKRLKK